VFACLFEHKDVDARDKPGHDEPKKGPSKTGAFDLQNSMPHVIARSKATKQSSLICRLWLASWSLSSGARSRDPLARNDDAENQRE
jgi:hypothetical protein